MGFRNDGLRAIAVATLVALASVSVQIAPAAAADPVPTATTVVASPTPTPTSTAPAPTPTPTAAPTLVATSAPSPTAATVLAPVVRRSFAARVVRFALAQRHKRYVRGAAGPRAFDCSGLVRWVYRKAGVSRHLGGGHSARAMYHWARRHHLTSRSHPRVGDIVVYSGGAHVAIYIGHGRVISALNPRQGIRVTRLHALRGRFTAFIHTHL